MKKKFVAILLVVLVLATVFAGCDIITKTTKEFPKRFLRPYLSANIPTP